MKIAYKIFHLEKDFNRKHFFERSNFIMSQHFELLDTPTISMSSLEDYRKFKSNHPNFLINPDGINLHGQGWKYGEIGLLASNWLAWENFLKTDCDYLILAEDDIIIHDDFFTKIIKYIEELPLDFDAFHPFFPQHEGSKYRSDLDVSKSLCSSFQDWSTLCYIINKNGAKKFIEVASKGINLPIDWYMFRQKQIFNVLTIKPSEGQICSIAFVQSTIQNLPREIINENI